MLLIRGIKEYAVYEFQFAVEITGFMVFCDSRLKHSCDVLQTCLLKLSISVQV